MNDTARLSPAEIAHFLRAATRTLAAELAGAPERVLAWHPAASIRRAPTRRPRIASTRGSITTATTSARSWPKSRPTAGRTWATASASRPADLRHPAPGLGQAQHRGVEMMALVQEEELQPA